MPKPKSRPQSKTSRSQSAQQGLLPRRPRAKAAKSAPEVVAAPQFQTAAPSPDSTLANHSLEDNASERLAFAHCVVDWPLEEMATREQRETNSAGAIVTNSSQVPVGIEAETVEPNVSIQAAKRETPQPERSIESVQAGSGASEVVHPTVASAPLTNDIVLAGSGASEIVRPAVAGASLTNDIAQPLLLAESGAPEIVHPAAASEAQAVADELQAVAGEAQVEPARTFGIPVHSDRGGSGVLPAQVVRDAQAYRGAGASAAGRWKWQTWVGAGLGAVLLAAGGAVAGAYSHFASGQTIAPNVFIAGVPVGGLTKAQAQQRLVKRLGSPRVALTCDGETVRVPLAQLGASPAIAPVVKQAFSIGRGGNLPSNLMHVYGAGGEGKRLGLWLDWKPAQLKNALQNVNSQVAVSPVDARLRAANDGLEIVPDRAGRAVDLDAAQQLVRGRVRLGAYAVAVPMRAVDAKVTARSLDGRDVQLAQYTTQFNAGLAGRTENIRIACRAIQNHILMPGETFSFNECTGQRTARKGYQMAHIFLRQPGADAPEVVEGLAGGVCQVSSTLFNAVRKTNAKERINPIKIVERSSHSLPVTYVPPGLDATVAWPNRDFKFQNVTDHPVYVRAKMGRSKVSISIWGRVPRV